MEMQTESKFPNTQKHIFYIQSIILGVSLEKKTTEERLHPRHFYSRCFSCTSVYPTDLVNQHNNITERHPSPPLSRNSSWGLIYFDIWRDLILMPTKNSKNIAKFWNAWAVRGNWCDSGKQKDQASEQTNKPKSKNALTECGLTPNIVHNNNHNVQEAADFFGFYHLCFKNENLWLQFEQKKGGEGKQTKHVENVGCIGIKCRA